MISIVMIVENEIGSNNKIKILGTSILKE